MMLYFFFYLYYFFLPGALLCYLLNFRKFKYLLAFSLSYSLLILILLPLQYFRVSIHWFSVVVNAEVALLLVLLVFRVWRGHDQKKCNVRGFLWRAEASFSGIVRHTRKRAGSIMIGVVLFGLILGYLLYVGPYTEVPSDVWTHLMRLQNQNAIISSRTFAFNGDWFSLMFSQGSHWYFIHSYLCRQAGISIARSIVPLTIANTLTFSFGVFFFGLFLFSGQRTTRQAKTLMSAISVLFYIVTFGVSVFAYVRYYALAPTILNYVIYLTVMAVILDFIRDKTWRLKAIWLIPFFLLVMNVVHSQEALFAYFMTLAVLLVEFCRVHFQIREHPNNNTSDPTQASYIWKINIALIAMLGSYVALFLLSHSKPFTWYDSRFAVPVETIIPFLKHMLIQPPLGQFYQVITVWGVFVYLLFFLKIRLFKKNTFIMGGMLIPILTVFNPVTVDMMLRLTSPDTLYRLSYCIPLPFVAAWIAIDSIHRLKRHERALSRMFHGIVLVGLLGLIFPVHTKYLESTYSRIYTLKRIPRNDLCLWRDLTDFLCSLNKTNAVIITDTATGYVTGGFTGIDCGNWRFYGTRFGSWLKSDKPAHDIAGVFDRLDLNRDWLLVINERDGAPSVSGRISRHWPEDIMNVSKCYSPKMKAYVENNPDLFELIWKHDRIRVYDIVEENVKRYDP